MRPFSRLAQCRVELTLLYFSSIVVDLFIIQFKQSKYSERFWISWTEITPSFTHTHKNNFWVILKEIVLHLLVTCAVGRSFPCSYVCVVTRLRYRYCRAVVIKPCAKHCLWHYSVLRFQCLPLDEAIVSIAVFVIVSGSDGRKRFRGQLNNSKTVRDIPYVSMGS